MDQFVDWADLHHSNDLLKNQDLDQYLENYDNEIDDLLNQTLLGIQDLDVPVGFNNELKNKSLPSNIGHTASNSFHLHQAKHSRKISGTAIFGFDNHTRELSIDLKDKSISPVQLVRMNQNNLQLQSSLPLRKSNTPVLKEEETVNLKKNNDFLSQSPKTYKFPPSPSPSTKTNDKKDQLQPIQSYSAKYLQELSKLNSNNEQKDEVYVDDIEPLLNKQDESIKYVPIPIQDPSPQKFNTNQNIYLPPPSPPSFGNESSPSPQLSAGKSTLSSSPVNPNYFYNPAFFSDDNNYFYEQEFHSPTHPESLSSSPIKNNGYYSSPLRNVPLDDVDETITQLTPLRGNQPMTPSRNKVVLEWSPIVSPNAKTKDVQSAIKQSSLSPKRRIKKTSLLPPGELDKFFEGPDDNKVFTCTYKGCGKKFTRRYNVRSHIQTHLSDRPFACIYCPKKFVRQHDLNRHVKGHLEARHCRCPCGKEFTRIDAMKKHRLRNICSGGVPLDQADLLKSPEKSPVKCHSPLKDEIQQSEDEISHNLLNGITNIPSM